MSRGEKKKGNLSITEEIYPFLPPHKGFFLSSKCLASELGREIGHSLPPIHPLNSGLLLKNE